MRRRSPQQTLRVIALILLGGTATAVRASDVQTGMVVAVGTSVESNPYNSAAATSAEAAATAELRPFVRIRDEGTTFDLQGLAQVRQFFHRYGLEDNYALDAQLVSRRSDRLTMRAAGSFSYNEGGFNGYGRPGLSPVAGTITSPDVPIQDQLQPLGDVTILGQRTRITSVVGKVGLDFRPSARSSLSMDVDGRAMRFKSAGFSDYNFGEAQFQYRRVLNDRTSVGVIASAGKTDYLGTRIGDASIFSGLISLDTRFAARWTLSAAGGGAVSEIRQLAAQPDARFTAFSLRLRLCRQGERAQFCLNAQRSPQPAANGNIRIADSLEADYALRVSSRDRFMLSGSYARTGSGKGVATGVQAIEFVGTSARFEHTLKQRMTVYGTASLSKIFSSALSRRTNVGILGGLQILLGAIK